MQCENRDTEAVSQASLFRADTFCFFLVCFVCMVAALRERMALRGLIVREILYEILICMRVFCV